MKVLLGIFGFIVLSILVVMGTFIAANNSAASYEQAIIAAYEDGQNVLGQYGQKIQEAAQIPDMQRDDLIAITKATMEGRYGADGSRALFQFISEQNPQLDQATYVKLQQMIEAGRNEFAGTQTRLIDKKRGYATTLRSIPMGWFMKIAGFPTINPDDYPVITTARAQKVYEEGKEDGPIKIR